MDESSLSSVIAVIALLIAHSLIALAYAALVNSRTEIPEESPLAGPQNLQVAQQITIWIIRLAMIAISIEAFVRPLTLQWPNMSWLAFVAVLLPLGLVDLLFAEMIPWTIGTVSSEQIAPLVRAPMTGLVRLLRPVIWLLQRLNRLFAGVFGDAEAANSITEEELLNLLDAGQSFEEDERKMIHSVLQLDQTTVTEIMIPRIDIVAVEKNTSIADARKVFLESGHSRLPVYEDNIDNIVGLAYVKDLLEVWHNGDTVVSSVEEITRPAHFVPETMTADQLLREFRKSHVHLFIVMEEYGGTGGLVTLENLLEEIVGDIQDEYDEDEMEDVIQISENEYRVDAGIIISDLNELLDVELDDEDVDTLGGFIFSQLERVPEEGEILETDDLELKVLSVEGRRIREVLVTRQLDDNLDEDDQNENQTAPTPAEAPPKATEKEVVDR